MALPFACVHSGRFTQYRSGNEPRMSRLGARSIALLLLLISFQQAAAGTAVTASTPTPVLREAAERGDAEALLALGQKMQAGLDMQADVAEGATWIRKAADQGYARAEYAFGSLMVIGKGVPQDPKGSIPWME